MSKFTSSARPTRLHYLWIMAASLYLFVSLVTNLASFPGLHGDEGWIGLHALRIQQEGLCSPHGMNRYTAPLQSWMIAHIFNWFGASIFSLRILSVCINTLAAFLLVRGLTYSVSPKNGFLAWCLLLSCIYFFWGSRLVWEITFLPPLVLTIIFLQTISFLERKRFSSPAVLLFLFANYIGSINHFLFISIPVSLFLTSSLFVFIYKDEKLWHFFLLTGVNFLLICPLFMIKLIISQELFFHYKPIFIIAFFMLPIGFLIIFRIVERYLIPRPDGLLDMPLPGEESTRRILRYCLTGPIVLFVVVHGVPFVRFWSSEPIFKRFASWAPGLFVEGFGYVWAIFFLTAFGLLFVRHIPRTGAPRGERVFRSFVLLWCVVYLLILVVFVRGNAMRYYYILALLMIAAFAATFSTPENPLRWRTLAPFMIAALVFNAVAWKEVPGVANRAPFDFSIWWNPPETSYHFLKLDSIVDTLRREKVCKVESDSKFNRTSLLFYIAIGQWECDPSKVYKINYCRHCKETNYFSIEPL